MKPHVAIIDYKLSNLFSVQHACEFVGFDAVITSDPKEVSRADAIILPGVGSFGDAMQNLHTLGLITSIHTAIEAGKPFMGICLGLQLLFTESDEFGKYKGLNIIPGKVKKFPAQTKTGMVVKIPQIGWNTIFAPQPPSTPWSDTPLRSVSEKTDMYFVHSYYVIPDDTRDILTLTTYEDTTYCSGIHHDNVTAFQFHPEKSGAEGISIYKNWL